MKKWQKYTNYKKLKNEDGTYTYIISVDGEDVEVSEKVYKAYTIGDRKMRYMEIDLKCDRLLQDENGDILILPEREISLEKLIDDDWEFPSPVFSPEEAFLNTEYSELDELRRSITMLEDDERLLVYALFFEGLTERQYAEKIGISKTALHARKIKVLNKIKILMRT